MDLPTPKTQPLDDFNPRVQRLDSIVEEYDANHVALLQAVEAGSLSRADYVDRMGQARKGLVDAILRSYADNCQVSSAYYENLVYSWFKQHIHVLDGYQSALDRVHEDQRNLHNNHTDIFTHLDSQSIDKYMNLFSEIHMVRTLMQGLGLDDDVDRVVSTVIQRELGSDPSHAPQRAATTVDLEFRTRPVKATMELKTKQVK